MQAPNYPSPPLLEYALELRVNVGPALEVGSSSYGRRRTIPIIGGTFAGVGLSGRVLPGGADWQLIETGGMAVLDARYVLETDNGLHLEVRNQGLRHGPTDVMNRMAAGEVVAASSYYFRTTPQFYPPEGHYEWLRRSIFIASGERLADQVVLWVWRIL